MQVLQNILKLKNIQGKNVGKEILRVVDITREAFITEATHVNFAN